MKSASHRRRLHAERRFQWYGRTALGFVLLLVLLLLVTLFARGINGFAQTQIRLPVHFPAQLAAQDTSHIPVSRFLPLVRDSIRTHFPEADTPAKRRAANRLLTDTGAALALHEAFLTHPEWVDTTQEIWLPASATITRAWQDGTLETILLDQSQVAFAQTLFEEGRIRKHFDWKFFARGDSRSAENSGFMGAIVGSLLTLLVCLVLAFPLGVATATYLEEFAPKHWITDAIEVNINNLAAVPSIIFGLLGLVIYINFFGMPRSSPLVAGLTLALLILPVVIIATRAALRAVPDTIRQAALALGASPIQAVFHHTLPLAIPGIMTGTILSIARALGETAPLLMIGMVAFVADIPHSPTDAATVMPVQIYLWAASPESGFAEKTAAGICVLLLVLLALNATAIYIRKRFEIRW